MPSLARSLAVASLAVPGLAVPALALAALAPAQDPAAPATTLRLELEDLAGEVRLRPADAGPLVDLAAERAALARYVGPKVAHVVALDESAIADVTLIGGDRVRGTLAGGAGDVLDVDLGGVVLPLSIESLRSIVFPARIPAGGAALPTAAAQGDALFLVAGKSLDRAAGLVESFEAGGLRFEDERAGLRTYPWDRVAALFVAPLAPVPREPGDDAPAGEGGAPASRARVTVGLAGGGRLSGRLVAADLGGVRLERPALDGGAPRVLELPATLVTEIALDDGSFRYLSDLPVADGGPESFFGDDLGFTWPHRIDSAVDGGPLRVGGRIEARGIGVHAPSRLTFELDGGWSKLRLSAAIDDSGVGADHSGSVTFRVVGDGRELWKSGVVRGGQAPQKPPALDVAGVRTLVLEVDPVEDFVLDRADWLRPILVRGR